MKHILTILAAAVALMPQPANAQLDKSPGSWSAPAKPDVLSLEQLRAERDRYRAMERTQAALRPIALPPVEFDKPYTGQVVVTKWDNYDLVRLMCKDIPNALACSYRVYNTSNPAVSTSCLIMLGPATHNDPRALRHEIGHCNGWSEKHEGAR
jgi:hypothetical protein